MTDPLPVPPHKGEGGRNYVELHCHSNYSFLEGASHPEELVARARDLEMPALAITDRNGFYGAVKFFGAAQRAGIQPIVGTELTIDDGTTTPKDRVDYDRWGDRLLLLVEDKLGYTSLCRLISMAQMPNAKGMARLAPDKLAGLSNHLIALVADPKERLPFYQEVFGRDRVFIELHDHLAPDDRSRNQALLDLAERHGALLVITNEVFYATPDRHRLHDGLTAIRHRTTLDEAQRYLHPNAEHYLKSGTELRQVFGRYPRQVADEGMAHAAEIAQRCRFRFSLVGARFPGFPVPAGETPFSIPYRLCQAAVRQKYHPVTSEVAARLQKDLDVINKPGFSEFFLINWDLMRFARSRGIPGQGRGSAADSIVAYLLGITRVDPIEHNLLFERLLHEEMTTTPDIDIDFSTAHREQVIQYIYDKYGPERTGMVCNVVTYRQRSAIREVGKVLGFKEETIDHLAKSASAWHPESPETIAQAAGYPTANVAKPWQQLFDLATQILDFPRHLSIHVGGMLVTGEPLIDIVPVERATMPGRMVVQFNKDDVEALGLVLYQEPILTISMDCAGFSSAEADRFRRAMGSHRSHDLMAAIRERFLTGCAANEIPPAAAEEIFTKLSAFAEFGFTKSHAAAFARTCYETAWLKLHHAPALYAGLLNNQPMGFYHPHVLVEDARHHGVKILPVDINKSYVRCTVESGALRLGFNYVHAVGDKALEVLEEAQLKGPVASLEDFCRRIRITTQSRNGLTKAQVQNLVLAGAFDALEPNRREAVWRFNEHADDWQRSPMLAEPSESVSLQPMTHRERVATDYRLLSLTTTDHLIHFYRPQFNALHVIDSKTIRSSVRDGAKVRVGGLVITRQSPSTGKEFKFFTLADEFGHVDVILRPPIYQRYRQVANLEPILIMDGRLQKQDGVMSVLVDHVEAAPSLPDEDVFPASRNYR